MRVSLLLQREAFAEVLEKTLARFLNDRYGGVHLVRWHKKPSKVISGSQAWYGNHYLNAFFVHGSDKGVLRPAMNEFSHSLVPWRRFPQRFYVALAASSRWRTHFAHSALVVTPSVPGAEQMVLIPGANKIRLVDFASGRCFVIGKEGALSCFVLNEIAVRRKHPDLPVPKLLEASPKGDWFCERLVDGKPLNRMVDLSKVRKIEEELFSSMEGLQQKTSRDAGDDNYPDRVFSALRENLAQDKFFNRKESARIKEGLGRLEELVTHTSLVAKPVRTCMSHGDFQPSNVLCSEDRFWLIDWEYAGRRCCSYDPLCWGLEARRPSGLSARVEKALRPQNFSTRFEPFSCTRMGGGPDQSLHLQLFLLEELLVRMRELSSPYILSPGPWFSEFLEEWDRSLDILKKNWLG